MFRLFEFNDKTFDLELIIISSSSRRRVPPAVASSSLLTVQHAEVF